jgi:cob(I)alamin adenosyltransferase
VSENERFRDPRVRINRVYTRTGDAGDTHLVGGQKVRKDDLRLEAYGTVDELNAHVGAAVVSCAELNLDEMAALLQRVQNQLFNLGSLLATLPGDLRPQQPRVGGEDVERLEAEIDAYNAELPALRSFVLPGGCRANTDLHLCRTVCRRAERVCVTLARREPLDPWAIPYLNRLSDAFFVWSRWVAVRAGRREVLWTPNET